MRRSFLLARIGLIEPGLDGDGVRPSYFATRMHRSGRKRIHRRHATVRIGQTKGEVLRLGHLRRRASSTPVALGRQLPRPSRWSCTTAESRSGLPRSTSTRPAEMPFPSLDGQGRYDGLIDEETIARVTNVTHLPFRPNLRRRRYRVDLGSTSLVAKNSQATRTFSNGLPRGRTQKLHRALVSRFFELDVADPLQEFLCFARDGVHAAF